MVTRRAERPTLAIESLDIPTVLCLFVGESLPGKCSLSDAEFAAALALHRQRMGTDLEYATRWS